jgi:hypothetical protein
MEHPDAWLLPLGPKDVDAARDAGVRIAGEVVMSAEVNASSEDMSELKTAVSMQDRIDGAMRRMDRERDGG